MGWNNSTLELGLFRYQSGEEDTNKYYATFVDGCRPYTEEFVDDFVKDDRTWRVAQIMAYVSGGSSIIATISTWLFVVSPLPARFFWPVVVLPTLVASFLAEASKFLFYDTSICRKNAWFPPGTESLPRMADCSFGATAIYGIASGIIFLVCLILVCLKAPNRRDLEPNYGLDIDDGNIDIVNPRSYSVKEDLNRPSKESSYDSDYEGDSHVTASGVRRPRVGGTSFYPPEEDGESGVTSINSRGYESEYELSIVARGDVQREIIYDDDDLLAQQRPTNNEQLGKEDFDTPIKPPATDVTIIRNTDGGNSFPVSRSRLETVERMEKNASDISHSSSQMIDKFLHDLDKSFEANGIQKEISSR
eukprot:CAMPEP_0197184988 /NCGR_PEP_ID=MMETSP1423-20130617/11012_1 /TAXON_ID=476441 /ORGANISM="Pseudo-nitzschia heimii, Strain UNC1101" /LENGTH=361 /DNA_ID=CAMNT_0042635947 /DNA_START=401 /DNA_END=1486 /DNA_ORIENTATION=-